MGNIYTFLSSSAAAYPDHICVSDTDGSVTFAQMDVRARALARVFRNFGLVAGDRVLLSLDNTQDYIAAYFAALYLGAIVVPVGRQILPDALAHIIAETAPRLIVVNAVTAARLRETTARFPDLPCVTVDAETSAEPLTDAPVNGGSSPALILYTSGTTRLPKGVTLSHDNLACNTDSILSYLKLTPSDSLLTIISFSYSYGNSLLLTHVKAGAHLVLERNAAFPIKTVEHLFDSAVTGFSTVGSYLHTLLGLTAFTPERLKRLRYITFAGESTSADDIARLGAMAPHLKIYVMYGQTEASARLSALMPDMLAQKPGSIGRGIEGVELRIVTEDGALAAPGVVGELTARGGNIMLGYWNNPDETARVVCGGWLYTGDLAVADADGYIYIKGRRDDQIKHQGHRISPAEIEDVLNAMDGVIESAVVSQQTPGGARIKAVVVVRDGVTVEDVTAYARKNLPGFKCPQIVELAPSLPRTSSGKIMRSRLRGQ